MWTREDFMKSAIEHGDLVTVRRLLAEGYRLEETFEDSGPKTALQFAALKGNAEIVEVLLDAGANVHTNGERYATPLHIAVLANRREICEMLLDRGANINIPNRQGMTPLHYAAISDDETDDVARLLLERGALVDAVDCMGLTALHHAAVEPARIVITKALLESGANPNQLDASWGTPLHRAEDAGTFNLLIEHGADLFYSPRNPPKTYRMPLDEGVANGGPEIAAVCQGILASKTIGAVQDALVSGDQDGGDLKVQSRQVIGISPL